MESQFPYLEIEQLLEKIIQFSNTVVGRPKEDVLGMAATDIFDLKV